MDDLVLWWGTGHGGDAGAMSVWKVRRVLHLPLHHERCSLGKRGWRRLTEAPFRNRLLFQLLPVFHASIADYSGQCIGLIGGLSHSAWLQKTAPTGFAKYVLQLLDSAGLQAVPCDSLRSAGMTYGPSNCLRRKRVQPSIRTAR